jgi:hypothetical protein
MNNCVAQKPPHHLRVRTGSDRHGTRKCAVDRAAENLAVSATSNERPAQRREGRLFASASG